MATTPTQAEAEGTPIVVDWEGVELTVPASVQDWDLDTLEAFEQGRAITAIKSLLGDDGYKQATDAFQAKHGRKVKVRDVEGLMSTVAGAYGFGDTGN
jgi:hypothetical protein